MYIIFVDAIQGDERAKGRRGEGAKGRIMFRAIGAFLLSLQHNQSGFSHTRNQLIIKKIYLFLIKK